MGSELKIKESVVRHLFLITILFLAVGFVGCTEGEPDDSLSDIERTFRAITKCDVDTFASYYRARKLNANSILSKQNDGSRLTSFTAASAYGCMPILEYIVKNRGTSTLESYETDNSTALMSLLGRGSDFDRIAVSLLEDTSVKLDLMKVSDEGNSALTEAIVRKSSQIALMILKHPEFQDSQNKSLLLNTRNQYGDTPLIAAIEREQDQVARELLKFKVLNVNIVEGRNRNTPLVAAISRDMPLIAILILEFPLEDINQIFVNSRGETFTAAHLLVKRLETNINFANMGGSRTGRENAQTNVRLYIQLLQHIFRYPGYDPTIIATEYGMTARDLNALFGNEELIYWDE